MRLVTYEAGRAWRAGVVIGDRVVDAAGAATRALGPAAAEQFTTIRGILESGLQQLPAVAEAAAAAADPDGLPRTSLRLGPPVPNPDKVLCIGLNYLAHQQESAPTVAMAAQLPDFPVVFNKFPSALIGDGEAVIPPAATSRLDWEAELAVVIGAPARNVAIEDALSHVAGYMTFNDVSARDLQLRSPQWAIGKGFDTSGPCGPELVLADEVPDPQALELSARLNGVEMQRATTADMIFSVAALIEYIASAITLVPGDIIATGTPAGVGHAREPQVYMKPGDVIEVEVEGLGRLTNPIEAPEPPFLSRLESAGAAQAS
jgi:2-keto-4-pentenoate hydratase/2-oxohepta-3-ene-1,7-dioic acid hydratase in catechol pathway